MIEDQMHHVEYTETFKTAVTNYCKTIIVFE